MRANREVVRDLALGVYKQVPGSHHQSDCQEIPI